MIVNNAFPLDKFHGFLGQKREVGEEICGLFAFTYANGAFFSFGVEFACDFRVEKIVFKCHGEDGLVSGLSSLFSRGHQFRTLIYVVKYKLHAFMWFQYDFDVLDHLFLDEIFVVLKNGLFHIVFLGAVPKGVLVLQFVMSPKEQRYFLSFVSYQPECELVFHGDPFLHDGGQDSKQQKQRSLKKKFEFFMELAVLALLAGISALSTRGDDPNAFDIKDSENAAKTVKAIAREIADGGDVYHVGGRSVNAAEAGLNALDTRFTPYGAVRQEPTHNIQDVIASRAENEAMVREHGARFLFGVLDTLGIHYGAPNKNAGYNIMLQKPNVSFTGDPNFSLAQLNKAFVDRYEDMPYPDYTTWYMKGDGEPTENFRAELGNEADTFLNHSNPYGPFGYYQSILRNKAMAETEERGHLKPDVLRAPPHKKHVSWNPRQPIRRASAVRNGG